MSIPLLTLTLTPKEALELSDALVRALASYQESCHRMGQHGCHLSGAWPGIERLRAQIAAFVSAQYHHLEDPEL